MGEQCYDKHNVNERKRAPSQSCANKRLWVTFLVPQMLLQVSNFKRP